MGKKTFARTLLLALAVAAPVLPPAPAGAAQTKERARVEKITELLAVVRDEETLRADPNRAAEAVVRLGEMKAVEAIPDLVRLLDFRRTFDWEEVNAGGVEVVNEITLITTAKRYPAVGALAAIGRPAVPALLKAVGERETDSTAGENALAALMGVFRESPSKGVKLLKKAAAAGASPLAAHRLLNAAQRAENSLDEARKQ
ncbi:MAG TPA: hypothetical protein VER32_09155 [Pyrinomonadaceae bacterium]|nr:hypothetical protein [Pyrinomonadaceae bacterium]